MSARLARAHHFRAYENKCAFGHSSTHTPAPQLGFARSPLHYWLSQMILSFPVPHAHVPSPVPPERCPVSRNRQGGFLASAASGQKVTLSGRYADSFKGRFHTATTGVYWVYNNPNSFTYQGE